MFLLIVAALCIGLWQYLSSNWCGRAAFDSAWPNRIDPWIAFVTLGVAVVIWFMERHREWVDGLPKRLDVLFIHKETPLMECRGADLASVTDIRALAQQIGMQMTGGVSLDFKIPMVQIQVERPTKDAAGHFIRYRAVLFLRNLPTPKDKAPLSKYVDLAEGKQCETWRYPFDEFHPDGAGDVAARWPAGLLRKDPNRI
ncbi:MAG: hypothetical protein HZA24_05885 [Nitrospirae bacterium]|nr:hypothetical protein [Nitrospirota bacterium]